jgi:hypothetical protein
MTIFSFFSRLINSAIAGLNEGKKLSGETAFSQIQVLVSLLLAKNLAGLSRQDCVSCRASLYVHLIVMQSNGQLPEYPRPKRHNAKHCPDAVRERIVNALANGDSKRAIARSLRVSNNTVTAVAEQQWQQVDARKQRIVAQCERNATLAADQLAERLATEKLSANQLVPVFGVSVDKMLALTGQLPSVQIAVVMPTPEEQAERRAAHARLDEITRRLAAP